MGSGDLRTTKLLWKWSRRISEGQRRTVDTQATESMRAAGIARSALTERSATAPLLSLQLSVAKLW
eukprot:6118227-Amphidinium_carterae.2